MSDLGNCTCMKPGWW